MKILGNKICYICAELNRKKRKTCQKCGLTLNNTIKGITSKADFKTREQIKKEVAKGLKWHQNKYTFICREVEE